LLALSLGETGERQNIGGTVSEFRVEAGDGLGGVISADDEVSVVSGKGVLGHHADASFDVAAVEIGQISARGLLDVFLYSVDTMLDVDLDRTVSVHEGERGDGIVCVVLHFVWQSHADEG